VVDEAKKQKLAQAFGVTQSLGGTEPFRDRPLIDQMRDITSDNTWAWIGREYWIPELSSCFCGLLFEGKKQFAAIMFRRNRLPFRNKILKSLKGLAFYEKGSQEVVMRDELNELDSILSFEGKLNSLLERVIEAVVTNALFRTSCGANNGA
jgi:hypothetical protein